MNEIRTFILLVIKMLFSKRDVKKMVQNAYHKEQSVSVTELYTLVLLSNKTTCSK